MGELNFMSYRSDTSREFGLYVGRCNGEAVPSCAASRRGPSPLNDRSSHVSLKACNCYPNPGDYW